MYVTCLVRHTLKSCYDHNCVQNSEIHIKLFFCHSAMIQEDSTKFSWICLEKWQTYGLKTKTMVFLYFVMYVTFPCFWPIVRKKWIPTAIFEINWWFLLHNSRKRIVYTSGVSDYPKRYVYFLQNEITFETNLTFRYPCKKQNVMVINFKNEEPESLNIKFQ